MKLTERKQARKPKKLKTVAIIFQQWIHLPYDIFFFFIPLFLNCFFLWAYKNFNLLANNQNNICTLMYIQSIFRGFYLFLNQFFNYSTIFIFGLEIAILKRFLGINSHQQSNSKDLFKKKYKQCVFFSLIKHGQPFDFR